MGIYGNSAFGRHGAKSDFEGKAGKNYSCEMICFSMLAVSPQDSSSMWER